MRLKLLHKRIHHQWSYCDSQKQMLVDILEGLPSRPHETSYLVAKGHKEYE